MPSSTSPIDSLMDGMRRICNPPHAPHHRPTAPHRFPAAGAGWQKPKRRRERLLTLPNQDTRHRENGRPTVTTPILHRDSTPPHTQTRVQEYPVLNAATSVSTERRGDQFVWTETTITKTACTPARAATATLGPAKTVAPPTVAVVHGMTGFVPPAAPPTSETRRERLSAAPASRDN